MIRDDIRKLLGGYATGTLTPEERQALFEAALADQELFDALAREEALREAMADPAARAQLLAAASDAPEPWYRHWWRPLAVVAAVIVTAVGVSLWEYHPEPKRATLAQVERPRFQPPVETHSAPVLPPPPAIKQAAPSLAPLHLPGVEPVMPPAPPADALQAQIPRPGLRTLQEPRSMGSIGVVTGRNGLLDQSESQAPAAGMGGGGGAGGRAGRALVPAAAAPMMMKAAPPLLQFELLRAVEGSAPVAVPQGATVPAGTTLVVRVTPALDGSLKIVAGDRTIGTAAVRRGVPSETALPPFQDPGHVELKVYFANQDTPAATFSFNIQ